MKEERRLALMALAALPGMGPINLRKLDHAMGGRVESLLHMGPEEQAAWCGGRLLKELQNWRRFFQEERVLAELERMEAGFVTSEEPDYPERLQPYPDRPIGLYRWDQSSSLQGRCLAIVGTRRPSGYGRKVARQFASELSRLDFTIISGLAEGIDTEAHRAALEAGGKTAAIMGGGLKRCYPLSNLGLMKEIVRSAGVWSEFPLWRNADRRSFPQRNRIVSGISEGVLVVESGDTGGSLITARMASEQGKPVYVVPGRIDAPESTGCHGLIRDGATLVSSVEDMLSDLNFFPEGRQIGFVNGNTPAPLIPDPQLPDQQARIWSYLGEQGTARPEVMAGELGMPVVEMLQVVMEMELSGYLSRKLDGCYERCQP